MNSMPCYDQNWVVMRNQPLTPHVKSGLTGLRAWPPRTFPVELLTHRLDASAVRKDLVGRVVDHRPAAVAQSQ